MGQACGKQSEILEAVRTSGSTKLRDLLSDLDPDEVNTLSGKHQRSALHLAAHGGDPKVVKTLLDHSASLDLADDQGYTALMFAAFTGATNVVRLLLEASASVNERFYSGGTTLHLAVSFNSMPVVRLLLNHDAHMTITSSGAITPLHLAASEHYYTTLLAMIEAGGPLAPRTDSGHDLAELLSMHHPRQIPSTIVQAIPTLSALLATKSASVKASGEGPICFKCIPWKISGTSNGRLSKGKVGHKLLDQIAHETVLHFPSSAISIDVFLANVTTEHLQFLAMSLEDERSATTTFNQWAATIEHPESSVGCWSTNMPKTGLQWGECLEQL